MRKSFATALLFAGVVAASAALAITRTAHSPAEPGSARPVETAPAKSAQIKGAVPIVRPAARPRSLFETCQHQDPSTPAVRTGTSGCFPLPYWGKWGNAAYSRILCRVSRSGMQTRRAHRECGGCGEAIAG